MRITRLLALALLLAVAGCGSDGGSSGDDQRPGDEPATTQKGGGAGYDYP